MRNEQNFRCANVAPAGANVATLRHRKHCANVVTTRANVATFAHQKLCACVVATGANGVATGANVALLAPAIVKALRYSLECLMYVCIRLTRGY